MDCEPFHAGNRKVASDSFSRIFTGHVAFGRRTQPRPLVGAIDAHQIIWVCIFREGNSHKCGAHLNCKARLTRGVGFGGNRSHGTKKVALGKENSCEQVKT